MLFNSFSFILIFLPIVLVLWHGLNRAKKEKLADLLLIAASLVFYGLFSIDFCLILLLSSLITFICYKGYSDRRLRKTLCISGVIINLLILGYYKYTGFFLENIIAITGKEFSALNITLPVGISFYVFAQISFLVDSYRERLDGHPNLKNEELLGDVSLWEYLLFITYFPKMVQGPIALPCEIIGQFRDREVRRFDPVRFRKGMELFIIGLSKKLLLGDNLAKIADYGFKYTYYMDTLTGSLVAISYALQLYFDFSGYCDMAEGVSYMIGIELPRNFNSPFKATSMRNLWQRWHMTLTRFFVRYVYIPLGGSRKGEARTAVNILIIFALSGLWHGAGWTFICWGILMGILVVFDNLGLMAAKGDIKKKYLLRDKPLLVIPKLCANVLTFAAFTLIFIFFRSQDITYALQFFKQLLIPTWPGFMLKTAANLDIPENYIFITAAGMISNELKNYVYLASWILLLFISLFVITRKNAREIVESETMNRGRICFLAILFAWSFISLSEVSTFLYFKF